MRIGDLPYLLSRTSPAVGASVTLRQIRTHWSDKLPAIIRPSFWSSLYPNLGNRVRNWRRKDPSKVGKSKEWNPATFYIWIFMLIGSQSINMIALKNDYSIFSRKADAKIALLKDVIEKIQRGEEVDVEKALGTGDEAQEQEWKDGPLSLHSVIAQAHVSGHSIVAN